MPVDFKVVCIIISRCFALIVFILTRFPPLQVKSQKSLFVSMPSRVTGHLVHPGAVLCMVDLLPSVDMSTQTRAEEEDEEEEEEEEVRQRGSISSVQVALEQLKYLSVCDLRLTRKSIYAVDKRHG